MFNKKLHARKVLKNEKNFTKIEETYFTADKMRVNCFKHLEEYFEDNMDIPYKTKRYIRKL